MNLSIGCLTVYVLKYFVTLISAYELMYYTIPRRPFVLAFYPHFSAPKRNPPSTHPVARPKAASSTAQCGKCSHFWQIVLKFKQGLIFGAKFQTFNFTRARIWARKFKIGLLLQIYHKQILARKFIFA